MNRRIRILSLALLAALLLSLAGGIAADAAEDTGTGGAGMMQAINQAMSALEENDAAEAADEAAEEAGTGGTGMMQAINQAMSALEENDTAEAADDAAEEAAEEAVTGGAGMMQAINQAVSALEEEPAPTEAGDADEPDAPTGTVGGEPERANDGKENAAFVKAAARAVTVREDGPELFYAGEDAIWYDLDAEPSLQPWFAMLRFRAKADEDDPSLVHYSCRIPGAVGTCFNMAYDVCFKVNEKYSKWVSVEGDVRVVLDEDGNRQIDISRCDNAFAVYAALRYVNPLYFGIEGIDISGGLSDEDFSDGLNILLNRSCDAYATLLGVSSEEYAESVVIPELEDYQAHMARIIRGSTCSGYGFLNACKGMSPALKRSAYIIGGALVLFMLFVVYVSVSGRIKDRKEGKVRKKKSKLPQDIVSNDRGAPELLDGLAHGSGYGFSDFGSFCGRFQNNLTSFRELEDVQAAAGMAAVLARKPENADASEETLRFLCKNIHLGLRIDAYTSSDGSSAEAYRHELLTAAGWSAAALGRLLARKMSPGDIAANLERLSPAIDKSNEVLEQLRNAYEKRDKIRKRLNAIYEIKDQQPVFYDEVNRLSLDLQAAEASADAEELEYSKGLGGFMLDNGDLPLAYLTFLLRDSQNRIPRFIKQGVIMGLVDWLVENQSHPEAGKLLQTVISVRADMIRSNSELTFFEVRAPKRCSRKDYAVLLADVLHCANPSLTYGDTEELLSLAEKEVPGVMDMLYACPLRLIDPANRQTLGFYQFKPYVHAMWVQYTPPLNTGKVISRYHEVDDRTKPLSSGLQLALFRDCYAVIPTLFHEYQHFCGDRNEASVFLKTQLFSIRFYKKYKQADAKADGVFAQLTTMLGLPPSRDKRESLNSLIERYYGRQVSLEVGEKQADGELAKLNRFIDAANAQETWDPEVKLPRLSDQEDKSSKDLIRDILIRFATVPKSVTEEEFNDILKGKAHSLQEMAGMPFSVNLQAYEASFGKNKGIDLWLDRMLNLAMGSVLMGTEPGVEEERVIDLLRQNDLDPTKCYEDLHAQLSDGEAQDTKSLQKYLRWAAEEARVYGDTVIRPGHLLQALLKHPTKAMKAAGIKGKKR